MNTSVETLIDAPKHVVWKIISDIDESVNTISGIEKIEVLERPESGLVGLKWEETRKMFGQTATEIMWITDVTDGERYQTRAESHGSIYISSLALDEVDGMTRLTMSFQGTPTSTSAKVLSKVTDGIARSSTEKALQQDLEDIKAAAEAAAKTG